MKEVEDKIKRLIEGKKPLSRQVRRQMERSGAKFDKKTTFTKSEVEKANASAYLYGKQLALKAAAEVIGLGPKRLDRIEEKIADLEFATFIKPFDDLLSQGASQDE